MVPERRKTVCMPQACARLPEEYVLAMPPTALEAQRRGLQATSGALGVGGGGWGAARMGVIVG